MAKKEDALAKVEAMQQKDLSSMSATAEDVARMLSEGAKLAESVVVLDEENNQIHGIYMGNGAPFDFTDPKTGEVRTVQSVVIESVSGKASARLIGNHQLLAKTKKILPGTEVLIQRGKDVDIGGGRTVVEFNVLIGRHDPKRAPSAA